MTTQSPQPSRKPDTRKLDEAEREQRAAASECEAAADRALEAGEECLTKSGKIRLSKGAKK